MASERDQLAGLAQQVMDVSLWMARHYNQRFAADLGLTDTLARSLLQLDPDRPVPTRALASMLGCDPSNVTPFVDRLEKAGLVERQVDPQDRRVKTLVVTTEGRAMLERMNDIRGTDSPPLQALTPSERETLEKLLDKARTAAKAYEAEQCARIQGKAI
ncbi:DNA-binding MarR family transcriptional regulator [Kribbella steppae]|uniref:DNA-binding MarR family transcriptional regulator n=1 Tax=Kribbella steppae TaxID=2512223 RepID=A0A4R2H1G7_9ACTN|nr:MarR family winged helix-turn-helix transcriptional regulator [Kribbella steppae]TCO16813.1 DNA-binding MarR family transcriptional regulator [Kribbella steppae]